MRKTENPEFVVRGSVLVLKGFVCVESLLHRAGLAVKRWWLRWLLTFASEIGMFHNRRAKVWGLLVDRLSIALEGVAE